ncbi:transposase [Microbacterium esteraromaticum]|uniref:Transposase n=1 Tax=Microbacterium esteraromaticum TaxID=57043 RepID=A0A7D7WBL8_9MICO|nr:transposase [Microbacterium esteraromaticum]QMU96279.1 transposase [Microbacterium esteraromaticum]
MSEAGELETIAAELYSGPPDAFIAARGERAKKTVDPELAAAVRALRKPSVAAWVVNLFAAERVARLGQALQLAAELREAQEDLDAATLSQLGRQRRALTNQLAAEAASLAAAQGARVTDATLEAVRQTISAAFFDPDAAAAVASGRLVRDLEPTTPVDLDAVVGGGPPTPPAAPAPVADEVAARRERRKAEQERRDAEKARERAERSVEKADRDARSARGRLDQLAARIAEVEKELTRLRQDREQAERDAEEADASRAEAADALDEAQDRLDALRTE